MRYKTMQSQENCAIWLGRSQLGDQNSSAELMPWIIHRCTRLPGKLYFCKMSPLWAQTGVGNGIA